MLDVMGRVMLGRRRDGFDVVEDALDRDVRDYAPDLAACKALVAGPESQDNIGGLLALCVSHDISKA